MISIIKWIHIVLLMVFESMGFVMAKLLVVLRHKFQCRPLHLQQMREHEFMCFFFPQPLITIWRCSFRWRISHFCFPIATFTKTRVVLWDDIGIDVWSWGQAYLFYTGIAMELSVAYVLEQMATADRLHYFYRLTGGVSLTSSLCLDKSRRGLFCTEGWTQQSWWEIKMCFLFVWK